VKESLPERPQRWSARSEEQEVQDTGTLTFAPTAHLRGLWKGTAGGGATGCGWTVGSAAACTFGALLSFVSSSLPTTCRGASTAGLLPAACGGVVENGACTVGSAGDFSATGSASVDVASTAGISTRAGSFSFAVKGGTPEAATGSVEMLPTTPMMLQGQ